MIGQSALLGYSTVCSCGCWPTPKLISVQDAAAGSDTRGHLCASLPWCWNGLQRACVQLSVALWHKYVKNGTGCLPCPCVGFKYCSERGGRLKLWLPDESKSSHFTENSYTANFFLSLPLKFPFSVPYFLHFSSQEVFLVEQFGLKLCQSVTRLILQPFFIMWVIPCVAQSLLLDIQRLEWEAPLFKRRYPLNNMPSYSC